MINLSFSACQKYILSPFSYYLHYILRLRPEKASSALVFGSAIDSGLNSLLLDKKNNVPVDVKKAKKVFEETLTIIEVNGYKIDARVKGSIVFSKSDLDESLIENMEIPENHDAAWYSLNEKGSIMIEAYSEQVLPQLKKVLAVQKEISVENQFNDKFTGVVDFIAIWADDSIILGDNKTATKKYETGSVSESQQLATYFEILKDDYKLDKCAYIVLPKNLRKKKLPKCEIQIIIGETPEELIAETFRKYDEVLHGIKNGKFECTGKCREQFWDCPYDAYCKSNGKDITGLAYKK